MSAISCMRMPQHFFDTRDRPRFFGLTETIIAAAPSPLYELSPASVPSLPAHETRRTCWNKPRNRRVRYPVSYLCPVRLRSCPSTGRYPNNLASLAGRTTIIPYGLAARRLSLPGAIPRPAIADAPASVHKELRALHLPFAVRPMRSAIVSRAFMMRLTVAVCYAACRVEPNHDSRRHPLCCAFNTGSVKRLIAQLHDRR